MKFATLLSLAGLASAVELRIAANPNAKSFRDLGNGHYSVPIVNGTLDYAAAIRGPALTTRRSTTDANATNPDEMPGKCVPQFPTRKTECRSREIRRADYLRALAAFLQWIESGPDDGWVEAHSCQSTVFGLAVVSACSKAGKQPTCRDEVQEAMRELDTYCAEDDGGDLRIKRWGKTYARHNIRDGDGLQHLVASSMEDDEAQEGEQVE